MYQQTSLHNAAAKGHDNTVLCLIRNGADKSIKDKEGVSVFDYMIDWYCFLIGLSYICTLQSKDPVVTVCACVLESCKPVCYTNSLLKVHLAQAQNGLIAAGSDTLSGISVV